MYVCTELFMWGWGCVSFCFHGMLSPRGILRSKGFGRWRDEYVAVPPTRDLNLPWEAVECNGSSTQTESWVCLTQAGHHRQISCSPTPGDYKGNFYLTCTALHFLLEALWFWFPFMPRLNSSSNLSFMLVLEIPSSSGTKLCLHICSPLWTASILRAELLLLCLPGPRNLRHLLGTQWLMCNE